MNRRQEPADAVARVLNGAVGELAEAIHALAAARIRNEDGGRELLSLAALLQAVLIGSNLLGRLHMEEDAKRAASGRRRAEFAKDPLPDWVQPLGRPVPFRQAITDLLSRKAILEGDYLELARRYSNEHVFGLARACDLVVTERVKEILKSAFATIKNDTVAVQKAIADAGDFSLSYAETVFRTNASTNYVDGRLEKAQQPHIRAVVPAMIFATAGDVDVRKNHKACEGLMAAPDDPIWRYLRPPLGYRCRCRLDYMSIEEAKAAGIIRKDGSVRPAEVPRGAHPDPGFRP